MTNALFDLHIWIKAKDLAKEIYSITKNKNFDQDRGLRDQLRRAVISVSSNIAEGYYRSSKNEFRRYLHISKGSCGEIISQLIIVKELGCFENTANLDVLLEEFDHLSRMIGKLINSLKKTALEKK
ncbi:MAG: four helix bundle protein [Candidatus Absconditabacterales bacterium]